MSPRSRDQGVGFWLSTEMDFTAGEGADILGVFYVTHGNLVDAAREYRVSKSSTSSMLLSSGCRIESASDLRREDSS